MPYKKLFSFRKIVFFLERRKSVYQANTKHFFFWTEIQFFQASTEKKFTLAFEKFFK